MNEEENSMVIEPTNPVPAGFDQLPILDLRAPDFINESNRMLKELRTKSPNIATPIIIVSSLSEPEMIERCMAAGANAYLVKPVERNSLTATVRAQIAGRAQKQP